MNKVSRTDEPYEVELEGYNQDPPFLSPELTTNADLNGIANTRLHTGSGLDPSVTDDRACQDGIPIQAEPKPGTGRPGESGQAGVITSGLSGGKGAEIPIISASYPVSPALPHSSGEAGDGGGGLILWGRRLKNSTMKFGSFIGPGFLIAVAYIDPGNYSTGVTSGATFEFRLLFVVLLSNLVAIFLQILCIKLGTVTGLDLAQACRLFLPRWMNIILYVLAEAAIIATDISEVIGFAIGLNLLAPAVPLVAGCAISILDVMVTLFFYTPHGSMKGLRVFEYFVVAIVLSVVVCFCIQLSYDKDTSVGRVFRGYLPSSAIAQADGLYQSCGILGATVMPHSLYLGSGIVQPRLREYDEKHGLVPKRGQPGIDEDDSDSKECYTPSLKAIQHSYRTSAIELGITLFTFALFVNSAILIVAGISLYQNPDAPNADLFSIHELLSSSVSSAAGFIFALSLLLSGTSAGIVGTISGQMVSEGALQWRVRPWLRRLVTRSISITPSIIIAAAVGRGGLNAALNGSQVVLSIVLPFVSAPLIYFTCRAKYMTVKPGVLVPVANNCSTGELAHGDSEDPSREASSTSFANSWYTIIFAILVWLFVAVLNVANLVLLGLGHGP